MAQFKAELSEANLPPASDLEIDIDLPEEEFGPIYERIYRRIQRLYMPLSHSAREKQVVDAVQALLLRHMHMLMEYALGESDEANEPSLHTLHRQLMAIRKQAFQWDYSENDLGGSAHIASSLRNLFFNDFAALHYLADQLVEEHWGGGCHVTIEVTLKAKLPVPANKAKQFVMRVASRPFFGHDGFTPFVTGYNVVSSMARRTKPAPEEE